MFLPEQGTQAYEGGKPAVRDEIPMEASIMGRFMGETTRTAQAAGPLQSGSRGPQAQAWQRFLVSKGIQVSVDGAYGPETASATAAFQKANSLVADGVVGPSTLAVAQVVHGYQGQAATPPQGPAQGTAIKPTAGQPSTTPATGQSPTAGTGAAAAKQIARPQAAQGKLNPTFPLPK